MSELKATPGPWSVDSAAYAGMDGIVSFDVVADGLDDEASGVAIVPVGAFKERDPQRIANAHLIAAAPELYEALILAVAYLSELPHEPAHKIASALAKARGQ